MNISELMQDAYIQKLTFTLATLVITFCISYLLKYGITLLFSGLTNRLATERALSRTKTIRNLLKSIIDIVLFATALLIILSQWGINILPILTGASILGLAISFGAQTFIKDLIAGFFIILEDQFNVGDRIKIDKYEGEVVSITLRMTILKDKDKNLVYVPNSQITTVVRLERPKKIIL